MCFHLTVYHFISWTHGSRRRQKREKKEPYLNVTAMETAFFLQVRQRLSRIQQNDDDGKNCSNCLIIFPCWQKLLTAQNTSSGSVWWRKKDQHIKYITCKLSRNCIQSILMTCAERDQLGQHKQEKQEKTRRRQNQKKEGFFYLICQDWFVKINFIMQNGMMDK